MIEIPINKFVTDQLSTWPLAAASFRSLKAAAVKEMVVGGIPVKAQCNPERLRSTMAGLEGSYDESGGCFLCEKYRPAEQAHLRYEGRKGRLYNIQVNPYPIFPGHIVVARTIHTDQSIWRCFVDMLDLSRDIPGYTIFYNGPKSGASKPDHMHFQGCPSGLLPLEKSISGEIAARSKSLEHICNVQDAHLYHYHKYTRGVFLIRAATAKSAAKLFYRLLDCVPAVSGEKEPRFNLFSWYENGEYRTIVIFRAHLRPHHFTASGEEHFTMSPGAADMGGMFVVPVEEEFERVNPKVIEAMLDEVSMSAEAETRAIWRLTRTQRTIDVGIMSADEIRFEIISDGAGTQVVRASQGRIDYNGVLYDELLFDAVTPSSLFAEPSFILHGVTIGVDFHWERKQVQKFAGSLRFIVENGKVTAINRVGVEDYLLSVISSEMKGSASEEFLKAHAVISRSWVMSQIGRRAEESEGETAQADPGDELITWRDHEDHRSYDVCADDHCQRYQGLGGTVSRNARRAVDQTWGEVLCCDGELCDTRFSKCCGGVTELFSTCWEDKDFPYLKSVPDTPEEGGDAFCNTENKEILSQVLNDYDLETRDFYRWKVKYSREELSALVARRSGIDFGDIESLQPVERGPSGRIKRLLIQGSKRTMTVGKELTIRRFLSESHLKSSAFDIECEGDNFILNGKGWGHGVGLCQIGAAVMASRGYDYKQILEHYYPGLQLKRR